MIKCQTTWGNVSKRTLDPKSVNDIVKQRAAQAGLDAAEFSAHGLRSGYLTEAANRGITLPETMEQPRHRSVQQASSYYNNASGAVGEQFAYCKSVAGPIADSDAASD